MPEDTRPPRLLGLTGSDRRSIGRVADAIAAVLARMASLFDGMQQHDPVLRMRFAEPVHRLARLDAA